MDRHAAPNINNFQFAITSSPEVAAKHKVEGEAVLLLKNFDDCRPVMSEDITEEAVVLFVSSKSLPPRGRVHPGHSSPLSTRPSARARISLLLPV